MIEVKDRNLRLQLEERIIKTLSLSDDFEASKKWLGNDSPEETIRRCGMWLSQGTGPKAESMTKDDMLLLSKIVKVNL